MECWITVPAIWSDGAQYATREAAIQAGFGSRPSDSVNMITEPEAAALWALKPHLGTAAVDPVQPGEHILVVDCGGGTVDLVTYEILQVKPLKFSEKYIGTGAKCGATAIDRNFFEFLELNFRQYYTELPLKKGGPGSTFMESFEAAKRRFGDGGVQKFFEIGEIEMKLPWASSLYDEDEQCVKISRDVMESFFAPPVGSLIAKLDDQVLQLKKKQGKLDRLVLVGGFGDSACLRDRLNTWRSENNVKRFTCPTDCQAAIVRGAVVRGLENVRPAIIIAKRHYGWRISSTFRAGIDREEDASYSIWDGQKQAQTVLWAVRKGQELDNDFKITKRLRFYSYECFQECQFSLELYSCALDEAPNRETNQHVRRDCAVTTIYKAQSEANRSRFNDKSQQMVYEYTLDIKVSFRATSGVLEFKIYKPNSTEQAGTTTISFDGC